MGGAGGEGLEVGVSGWGFEEWRSEVTWLDAALAIALVTCVVCLFLQFWAKG